MIPEFGAFALILALCFAFIQASLPIFVRTTGPARILPLVKTATFAQFIFIVFAYLCLTWAFASSDFSVSYVANNSSRELPFWYRLTAVWGGHEGSMLLWVTILAFWSLAVMLLSQRLPRTFRLRVLSVLGWVSFGFLLFLLATSNPFLRLLPQIPDNGVDLNPLLQDPGFLIHPPLLYLGYVGFSVVFAYAIAAMIEGRLESTWTRWVRPWTLAAWICLTCGITLGSWWAYRVLGWGGWWFWDPVENASFLPWLAGTALIHSLIVSEKRNAFYGWTVFLAILTFSLSLLGTFLIRSGVLTSVHAFAVDPARGLFILVLLFITIGGSLLLYAVRGSSLRQGQTFDLLSRETCLLFNNVILSVALFTVLLGTLYPLLIDVLNLGSISVGAPYFNRVFMPLMVPLLFVMAMGPHFYWRAMPPELLLMRLRYVFLISLGVGIGLPWIMTGNFSVAIFLGLFLALWIIIATIYDLLKRIRQRNGTWGQRVISISRSQYGMVCAHIGVAICVIGITFSTQLNTQRDVVLSIGDNVTLAPYTFHFVSSEEILGSNFQGIDAQFEVSKGEKKIGSMVAEKRYYNIAQDVISQPAIKANLWRDIYVAIGNELPNGAWSIRLYYKPFVRWIWLGAILIAIGGLLAATARRKGN